MFREMRRKKQQLSDGEAVEILQRGTAGVLAVAGDDGYPYAVPLSYVYRDGKILFHCAKDGHKIDAIARCPKVSFCVIERDEVVPQLYTTLYRSAIAFGTARVLTGECAVDALKAIGRKYAPNDTAEGLQYEIAKFPSVCVVQVDIENLTAKQSKRLLAEQ